MQIKQGRIIQSPLSFPVEVGKFFKFMFGDNTRVIIRLNSRYCFAVIDFR